MAGRVPYLGEARTAETERTPYLGPETGKKKEKKGRSHLFGIPLLHPGEIPGEALSPFVWAGDKAGIIPKWASRVSYVLDSAPAYAARHPVKTAKGLEQTVVGLGELPYAAAKAYAGKAKKDPLETFLGTVGAVRDPTGAALTHRQKVAKVGKMLAAATAEDYKKRYGKDWKRYAEEEPFNNLLDFTTAMGGVTRGLALGGAASRLGEGTQAGKLMLALSHPRAVWKESGRFPVRYLEYEPPTGAKIFSEQPPSRSPLRAMTQQWSDEVAHRHPTAPLFGARSRITRAQSKQIERTVSRLFAAIPGGEAVTALKKGERDRLYWGGQMGKYDADTLRRIKTALTDHYDEPISPDDPLKELLFRARQAGYGPGLLHSLDLAITHAEKVPDITGARLDKARQALEHATEASENLINDVEGVAGLEREIAHREANLERVTSPEAAQKIQDELDALYQEHAQLINDQTAIMDKRRYLLPDWVNAMEAKKFAATSTPLRDARIAEMTKLFGSSEQAQHAANLTDYMAARFQPEDMAGYWENRIGGATAESASQYVKRIRSLPPGASRMQYALNPFGAERASRYYSRLVKAVDEEMGRSLTSAQLRALLSKHGVAKEELQYTGLRDYLDARERAGAGPNEKITKEEVKQILDGPDNMFNLIEHHWTNNEIGERPPWLTHKGGGINSREAAKGEYHHLAFGLPEESGSPFYGKMLDDENLASGYEHTRSFDVTTGKKTRGRSNVIAHVRYHIFEDGGKLKMLVEEVQSDWASQFRKQSRGWPFKRALKLSPKESARLDDLLQEKKYLENEIETAWQNEASNAELGELEHRAVLVDNELRELQRLPPSPLGPEKYLDTVANRIAQEAHKHGVDQIVVSDAPTQTARNARPEQAALIPWDAPTEELAAHVRQISGEGAFKGIYERDFPEALARATGEKGHHDPAAYTGQFRSAYTNSRSAEGPMGGTVFDLGENAAKNAETLKTYYQAGRTGRLPRGATEFFQDGKTAIRLFRDADLDTYLHELSHVALHDLPDESKLLLEKHFGNGTPVAKWTEDMHEEYARSFERYMATGQAPTRALEPVFAKISAWLTALWRVARDEIPDIHPEVRQAFDSMFLGDKPKIFMPHRPGRADVSGARVSRGITRGQREIGDQVMSQGANFKRNTLALLRSGVLNPDPVAALEHLNRLVHLNRANQLREAAWEGGRAPLPGELFDPETQYAVRRAGRSINKPLYDAMDNARDSDEIRKNVAEFIDQHITSDPDRMDEWSKLLANDPAGRESFRVVDKTTIDQLFKNVTGKTPGATTKPSHPVAKMWDALLDSTRGMLLYANPGFYVANMAGNAMMMMLADPRAARYFPWSMRQALKVGRGEKVDPLWHRISVEMGRGPTAGSLSERRPLLGADSLETRRARMQRALRKGPLQAGGRAGENVSHFWGKAGRGAGKVVDDSFRVAAWRQVASKYDYTTDKQIEKLLDDAVRDAERNYTQANSKPLRDLNAIRDEAEQLMLDFDSLTPFEKQYMTRTIFLYPFLKASAKYPFMYAGERPLVAGLGGQAAIQSQLFANQVLGPRDPNLPKWMEGYARTPWGYLPVGSVSPFSPLTGLISAAGNLGGEGELGVQRPIEFANPMVQMLIDIARQQNKFGKSQPFYKTLREEAPLPAYLKQATGLKQPGKIYEDRSWLATLERAFRLPFEINEAEAAKQARRQ